jgi:hypothetical protein
MLKDFTCPYCNKPTTATSPHVFDYELPINLEKNSELGKVYFVIEAISCPNAGCNKLFLKTSLVNKNWVQQINQYSYSVIKDWQLLPESEAKVLPSYVPNPISEDYYEACRIRDLSSKASATLSRRCLQGMIRDFWKIKKNTLKEETEGLKDLVDSLTWEAIDSVRKVGNIGAHMEKDTNLIIDIDAGEAQLLIELIEQLVDDWYVARNDKQERLKKIKGVAELKEEQKTNGKKQ